MTRELGIIDDRYRLVNKLGEGAMGEVYLAENLQHGGRLEAVKILHARLADAPELVARFRREARAMSRLQHPSIVALYDCGLLDGEQLYLSTEYVSGPSLEIELRRGPIDPARALEILEQLAQAVDHAHRRGVIHRDLKPANLLFERGEGGADLLRILDFGFAKIVDVGVEDGVGSTRRGEAVGSPHYMAPEQFMGNGREPRIDVYATGCIAYEMLTGEPPFQGRPVELMRAHVSQAPTPPERKAPQSAISPALSQLVLRCLAKNPEQRFSTAAELANVIAALRARLHAPARVEPFADSPPTLDELIGEDETQPSPRVELEQTAPIDVEDARLDYFSALQTVAATFVDLGCRDGNLEVCLRGIAEIEADLAAIGGELKELGRAEGLSSPSSVADDRRRALAMRRRKRLEARDGAYEQLAALIDAHKISYQADPSVQRLLRWRESSARTLLELDRSAKQ